MSLLVVGLSHRSAPVSVLERAALSADAQASCCSDTLAARARRPRRPCWPPATASSCTPTWTSSTRASPSCPRCSPQHSGVGLGGAHPVPLRALRGPGRPPPVLGGLRAGLDGRRRGRRSSARSRTRSRSGRSCTPRAGCINDLFQQALRVGKRAHSETGIDRAGQSLVTFGLEQLAGPARTSRVGRGQAGAGDRRRLDVLAGRGDAGAGRCRRTGRRQPDAGARGAAGRDAGPSTRGRRARRADGRPSPMS